MSGSGRKRTTDRHYSAEDQALDQISKEAEERIQARRQARAEAREMRLKEIERQQKEEEDKQKAQTQGTDSVKALSSYSGSRRGSNESTESDMSSKDSNDPKDQLRKSKMQLRELEDKYKAAMLTNAQLDNIKTSNIFQIELLKEQLEEQEEQMLEVQREYKDKSRDYDFLKRDFDALKLDNEGIRHQMDVKDRLLKESGLVIVQSQEGEFSLTKCSDMSEVPVSELGTAVISEEAADLLKRAGEGTLGNQSVKSSASGVASLGSEKKVVESVSGVDGKLDDDTVMVKSDHKEDIKETVKIVDTEASTGKTEDNDHDEVDAKVVQLDDTVDDNVTLNDAEIKVKETDDDDDDDEFHDTFTDLSENESEAVSEKDELESEKQGKEGDIVHENIGEKEGLGLESENKIKKEDIVDENVGEIGELKLESENQGKEGDIVHEIIGEKDWLELESENEIKKEDIVDENVGEKGELKHENEIMVEEIANDDNRNIDEQESATDTVVDECETERKDVANEKVDDRNDEEVTVEDIMLQRSDSEDNKMEDSEVDSNAKGELALAANYSDSSDKFERSDNTKNQQVILTSEEQNNESVDILEAVERCGDDANLSIETDKDFPNLEETKTTLRPEIKAINRISSRSSYISLESDVTYNSESEILDDGDDFGEDLAFRNSVCGDEFKGDNHEQQNSESLAETPDGINLSFEKIGNRVGSQVTEDIAFKIDTSEKKDTMADETIQGIEKNEMVVDTSVLSQYLIDDTEVEQLNNKKLQSHRTELLKQEAFDDVFLSVSEEIEGLEKVCDSPTDEQIHAFARNYVKDILNTAVVKYNGEILDEKIVLRRPSSKSDKTIDIIVEKRRYSEELVKNITPYFTRSLSCGSVEVLKSGKITSSRQGKESLNYCSFKVDTDAELVLASIEEEKNPVQGKLSIAETSLPSISGYGIYYTGAGDHSGLNSEDDSSDDEDLVQDMASAGALVPEFIPMSIDTNDIHEKSDEIKILSKQEESGENKAQIEMSCREMVGNVIDIETDGFPHQSETKPEESSIISTVAHAGTDKGQIVNSSETVEIIQTEEDIAMEEKHTLANLSDTTTDKIVPSENASAEEAVKLDEDLCIEAPSKEQQSESPTVEREEAGEQRTSAKESQDESMESKQNEHGNSTTDVDNAENENQSAEAKELESRGTQDNHKSDDISDADLNAVNNDNDLKVEADVTECHVTGDGVYCSHKDDSQITASNADEKQDDTDVPQEAVTGEENIDQKVCVDEKSVESVSAVVDVEHKDNNKGLERESSQEEAGEMEYDMDDIDEVMANIEEPETKDTPKELHDEVWVKGTEIDTDDTPLKDIEAIKTPKVEASGGSAPNLLTAGTPVSKKSKKMSGSQKKAKSSKESTKASKEQGKSTDKERKVSAEGKGSRVSADFPSSDGSELGAEGDSVDKKKDKKKAGKKEGKETPGKKEGKETPGKKEGKETPGKKEGKDKEECTVS